jgi:hypothetical protein
MSQPLCSKFVGRGVTNTNGPKVLASLSKTWLYAGNSEHPALLAPTGEVKTRPVRTISREVVPQGIDPSETTRRASARAEEDMVRAAWRHAEVGRNVRPAGLTKSSRNRESVTTQARLVTGPSEIPCRVSSDLHEWRNDLGAVSTRGSVKL